MKLTVIRGVKMKFILKNSNNEQKPYFLRVCDPLKPVLADLNEFDGRILEPIELSNYQKDFLSDCARTFWVVSYLPISVIRFILDDFADGLTHFAFCTHDRDYTADNELKKPHTHLLLYFDERVSASYVAWLFHTVEIKVISRIDISNEWNYLIHDSNACRKQRKHQYNANERFSDDEHYWLQRCTAPSSASVWTDMYLDYSRNRLSVPDMISRYGLEFIRQIKNLRELSGIETSRSLSKQLEQTCDYDEVF